MEHHGNSATWQALEQDMKLYTKARDAAWAAGKKADESAVGLMKQAQKKVMGLSGDLKSMDSELLETKLRLAEAVHRLRASGDIQTELEKTKIELEKTKAQLSATRFELDITKTDLNNNKKAGKASKTELEATVKSLKATEEQLTAALEDAIDARDEILDYKANWDLAEEKILRLEKALSAAKDTIDARDDKILRFQQALSTAKDTIRVRDCENIVLKANRDGAEIKILLLEQALSASKKETAAAIDRENSALANAKEERHKMANDLHNAANERDYALMKIRYLEREAKGLDGSEGEPDTPRKSPGFNFYLTPPEKPTGRRRKRVDSEDLDDESEPSPTRPAKKIRIRVINKVKREESQAARSEEDEGMKGNEVGEDEAKGKEDEDDKENGRDEENEEMQGNEDEEDDVEGVKDEEYDEAADDGEDSDSDDEYKDVEEDEESDEDE